MKGRHIIDATVESAHDVVGKNKLSQHGNDEIELGALALALWKGKWWIAVATAIGIASGVLVIANTNPTFQADALLQLEEKASALALPSNLSVMVDNDPRSVTEIEILRSRLVLGRAVAAQNLDWRVSPHLVPFAGTMFSRYGLPMLDSIIPVRFARPGDQITLANLVVPRDWLNQGFDLEVLSEQDYVIVLPDARHIRGVIGIPLEQADIGMSVTVASLQAPTGRKFVIRQVDENRAVNDLRQRLAISERGRASGIIEVRLRGQDPLDNTRGLNAIVDAYIYQNVVRNEAKAESTLAFIEEQIPQAERNLREAESVLNAFRQQEVTIDLSLETQIILSQITGLEGEVAELERREGALRDTPAHPAFRQLGVERLLAETRLAKLREQVDALPETERQIQNLSRAVEIARRIYADLRSRAQDIEVLRAGSVGSVRVVDMAAADPSAIAPRKWLVLALGVMSGAMLGSALVLFKKWMHKGIQDDFELEQPGLPVLATINFSKVADRNSRRHGKLPILACAKYADVTVEGLRSLRTSLQFGMFGADTPTMTITSPEPEAGKSFVALNLAAVAAQAGQRVCLVDADLRRGQLSRHFDLPRNHRGLAEVLAGKASFEESLVHCPIENLSFIPTGQYPQNPSELLMRVELSELIEWCAENFDLTIFDSPPILAVTDAAILARNTGFTILVARYDATQVEAVEAALKAFTVSGLRMSGAVLNAFDPKKARGGYGYGNRYSYNVRDQ